MKKDKYQLIYYICCVVYAVFLIYAFYDNYTKGYTHSLTMTFVSFALVFVVPIGFKLLRFKPVYEIYILAIIFMFLASLLGSSYRFYDHVMYWDKYVHAFSGVLGALLAYILYCVLKKTYKAKNQELTLMYIFVNAINVTIATLWELFEYAGLVLFDYDGIRHYTSGVHDSMSDIIVCIVGGLFSTYFIYRYYATQKENIFVNIYRKFYQVNMKK